MNFYFCEKCGKRINDDEVKNKGLKGWYCSGCAVGVMTMEMSAVSEQQARALIEKEKAQQPAPPAPPPDTMPEQLPVRSKPRSSRSNIPVRPSGLAPAAPPSARPAKRESAPAPAAAAPRNNSQAVVIGSVAAAAVLLIAFLVLRSPKKPAPESGPTPVAAGQAAQIPIAAKKNEPLTAATAARNPNSAEGEAERAFEELRKKLDALGDDKEKKIAAAEDYLDKYNEFIIAARVRTILDGLTRPQAQQADDDKPEKGQKAEENRKAVLQRLKETNPDFDGLAELNGGTNNQFSFMRLDKKPISDISALKGLTVRSLHLNGTKVSDLGVLATMTVYRLEISRTEISDLSPLKGQQLVALFLSETKVKDLSPLKGMPLVNLELRNTAVSDLTPVKGMPLLNLLIGGTEVADLSPLKGMKLESLNLERCPVESIAALEGIPLQRLTLIGTKVTDLTPLKGMPLKQLNCNFVPERDTAILKSIPTLEKLNTRAAHELLKGAKK